ncbi:MAG: hypothetical protein AAFU58_00410, partial [Pseudomonadota bacterium]
EICPATKTRIGLLHRPAANANRECIHFGSGRALALIIGPDHRSAITGPQSLDPNHWTQEPGTGSLRH